MEIDFFDENCQSRTKAAKFGLCDEPPPSTNPAYIDLHKLSLDTTQGKELKWR